MRTIDELIESAMDTIHWGFCHGPNKMAPLFSGGHDSLVATHLASQHERFSGDVHHIDTGIGARYTRRFVESTCEKFGWNLIVHKSPETYEKFVSINGFPGPAGHRYVYQFLKERCVREITRGKAPTMLVSGARVQESVRRMGNSSRVQMGDVSRSRKRTNTKRIWTAPCHDWTKAEQCLYMDEFGLPANKLKTAIGMSGECFCGAFAQPNEIEAVRQFAPDVAAEIDRLAVIAKECGTHCVWGTRPAKDQAPVAETGPLCTSCDRRAANAGIVVVEN